MRQRLVGEGSRRATKRSGSEIGPGAGFGRAARCGARSPASAASGPGPPLSRLSYWLAASRRAPRRHRRAIHARSPRRGTSRPTPTAMSSRVFFAKATPPAARSMTSTRASRECVMSARRARSPVFERAIAASIRPSLANVSTPGGRLSMTVCSTTRSTPPGSINGMGTRGKGRAAGTCGGASPGSAV